MTDLQPPLRPVIRIYLSSNFTDMVMEKTELVNHIFPIIRKYCKDRHGLDFQVGQFLNHKSPDLPGCRHEMGSS